MWEDEDWMHNTPAHTWQPMRAPPGSAVGPACYFNRSGKSLVHAPNICERWTPCFASVWQLPPALTVGDRVPHAHAL